MPAFTLRTHDYQQVFLVFTCHFLNTAKIERVTYQRKGKLSAQKLSSPGKVVSLISTQPHFQCSCTANVKLQGSVHFLRESFSLVLDWGMGIVMKMVKTMVLVLGLDKFVPISLQEYTCFWSFGCGKHWGQPGSSCGAAFGYCNPDHLALVSAEGCLN